LWLALLLLAAAAAAPPAARAANCSGAPGRGLTLANVAADGARVGAVGSNGLMARARRLDRWRIVPTPVEHDLRGIVWTGERWVLAGDLGTILSGIGGEWLFAAGGTGSRSPRLRGFGAARRNFATPARPTPPPPSKEAAGLAAYAEGTHPAGYAPAGISPG
jgi:hypothetical protein